MTSNDTAIINLINSRFDALDTRMDNLETRMTNLETRIDNLETRMDNLETRMDNLDTRMTNLEQNNIQIHAEIRALEKKVDENTIRLEELHFSFNLWFTVIAIVVGLVACVITLAPMFREIYRDAKNFNLRQEINDAVARAVSEKFHS